MKPKNQFFFAAVLVAGAIILNGCKKDASPGTAEQESLMSKDIWDG